MHLPLPPLLVALVLAGCVAAPAAPPHSPSDMEEAAGPGWPPLDEHALRPGTRIDVARGVCTSNFLFRSADNASLYLGVAAHCFEAMRVGDPVRIGEDATGVISYSSFETMGKPDSTLADAACANETDEAACAYNDFGLVRIDDKDRPRAHPALRHFGGPSSPTPAEAPEAGARVHSYGNSVHRQGVEQSNWHEGVVLESPTAWTTHVYFALPAIPGDSGSAAILDDGSALGVVVGLLLERPGGNAVVRLGPVLDYARTHGGPDVALLTWDLLAPPLPPRAPLDGAPGALTPHALPARPSAP